MSPSELREWTFEGLRRESMAERFLIVPEKLHNDLVAAAYRNRGFSEEESDQAARFAARATWHGVRTHNAIKALELDDHLGSGAQGCVPRATIKKLSCRFEACEIWDANRKLGQAVASLAMQRCIELADRFGIGMVNVDNAFHYLWGGGHVMEVAEQGYIGYTNCPAALTEVIPFGGKSPTLGTNPHSWGFPTTDAVGFPIVIDWATSIISMGRIAQFAREGLPLPPDAALDANGKVTTDARKAVHVLPFGGHKGYSLCLLNELVAAFIGGSLPTGRNIWADESEKHTCTFHFQVIHPDALNAGAFAKGRNQTANVRAVVEDILGHGNKGCMLPGQLEAEAAKQSELNGGLLFSEAEIEAFNTIARECSRQEWKRGNFKDPIVSNS